MPKGVDFEIKFERFLDYSFDRMGFDVIEIRRQNSGTQNGFDVLIKFLDESDSERKFYFECKDYSKELAWKNLLVKIHELDSSAYDVDCFIGVSPKANITNINHLMLESFETKFKFPIYLLTPDTGVKEIFSLNQSLFEDIYNENLKIDFDEDKILHKTKSLISNLIERKLSLNRNNGIVINPATRSPNEDPSFKTKLDEKLDSVLEENDSDRLEYHELRCDYKVFLEDLQDLDNELRVKILNWQNDLRLVARRLTKKFNSFENYTPISFYFDFFDEAQKRLYVFINNGKYSGDIEKLLNGIVFELAAECPLDWRK